MCGILGIFASSKSEEDLRKKLIECSLRIRHRGPDWSGYLVEKNVGIAHERLAIIDPESGSQPLVSPDKSVVVAVNGEIYNYQDVYASLTSNYKPVTGSDCEVIIPLYLQGDLTSAFLKLRGMFAAVIYDRRDNSYVAVRDHVGIIPLYIGYGSDGSVWFSSEMKSLAVDCARFEQFPPGHFYSSKLNSFQRWFNPLWMSPSLPQDKFDKLRLRHAFESSVRSHIMSDVPWGVLLSGGLDSSLVASVASRMMKESSNDSHVGWFPKLHSFCIGLENSPDLKAAAIVAKFIGTIHHGYTYTIQEGLDAISEVIYHLETYDTTTIRAATPMFLMSRKIKAMGIKMVLSGEGADEIFGGYLYFHKAPNAEEFQAELLDKISNLYMFDNLRANKSTAAWGVEARVPFLDSEFMDVAMNIDPSEKMILPGRIEKYVLRAAFDEPSDPYLPNEILWRQKEQFSDGVGYGWIDSLRDHAESRVTDQMFANAHNRFPERTPLTKEAYLYRSLFEDHFPQVAAVRTVPYGPSIACSTSRAISWDESFKGRADCSGRSVASVHNDAYNDSFAVGVAAEDASAPSLKRRKT